MKKILHSLSLMILFLLMSIVSRVAIACEGSNLIVENLELCVSPGTDIRVGKTKDETQVFLVNEESGSLVLSIQDKPEKILYPSFDVELGTKIHSEPLIKNSSCIFRTLNDVPFEGNVSIEGVLLTFDYLIQVNFLKKSPVFHDFMKFCEN
ncbi:hypothetical protein [Alteromonas sp. a30]|uniref:hypothetical protein n=1 Tax=Alteromonas sp. a30 TaxID=2730917 RepID=UPI00228267B5|nr:hypothetical protein [Alteromonas sp. a30]MCY7297495.1 hypothetical protein [Alteromonas sp. a30]